MASRLSRYILQTYFVLKGIRYPIFKKRRNLKCPPIKLYWWFDKDINNFGDLVSKDILLNIFGRSTEWAPPNNCDMIAAGSIIEIIQNSNPNRRLYAWGSGFIKKDDTKNNNNSLNNIIFKAVRGRKTLSRIKSKVPTGDPGILVGPTYLLKRNRKSKKIGVVIHYADFETDIARKIKRDPRFEIINPLDEPKNVAQKIADCGLILSSSLHGLVFADSLSIPNAHLKISDNLTGGIYKFQDYYSGVDKKYLPADINKIFDDAYLDHLKRSYQKIPNLSRKQRALIKAFPFN